MVAGGVVGVPPPDESTATSSKPPLAYAVTRPIRPAPDRLLLPEAIWVPLTKPRMVLPLASMRSVYQVPVLMPSDAEPIAVMLLPLTACNSARPEPSSASRYILVLLVDRAASPTRALDEPKLAGRTRACTE